MFGVAATLGGRDFPTDGWSATANSSSFEICRQASVFWTEESIR